MLLLTTFRQRAPERRFCVLDTEIQTTALVSETNASARPSAPSPRSAPMEVAGYELKERIGTGGFGEVWKAIGPGGFAKAVKILYGNLAGTQAETELLSLNRMRELRHPFLLSVERVEIVDGRAVIVTELADRSLEDRFREILATGQKGIPRDELIGYLRDAADALDFMCEQHGLQHLDVKPDNLLLQGKHAKLGDFGLTKSLRSTGHSMVNGFTPLYAPPELFDGRPERSSDQYSLAICYQMMLTGTPPFNGRSAAQLTSQHLKSPPDLSPLPPADRPVISRALSKSPRLRFSSCREMIDELSRRRGSGSAIHRSVASPDSVLASGAVTDVIDNRGSRNVERPAMPSTPVKPPVEESPQWQGKSTIFISIGGMGAQVLSIIRERLHERFPTATLPAFQFVTIDSDAALIRAVIGQNQSLRTECTTIAATLKTSHEYRKASRDHLNWLSRRWLYNIPRSGQVEGLRPLGRLAFVDHEREIRDAVSSAIRKSADPQSAELSERETSLPFSAESIEVILVGSTSGGTCSGCIADVAWMIRSLARELRLPPLRVSACLLHGTASSRTAADIQDANTVSLLTELNYLSLPGTDRRAFCGTRSGDVDPAPPFEDAVFLHFGDDLTNQDFERSLEQTADYLELRTLTCAGQLRESWRRMTTETEDQRSGAVLRTVGLATGRIGSNTPLNIAAARIAAATIDKWTREDVRTTGEAAITMDFTAGDSLLMELGATRESSSELLRMMIREARVRRIDEYADTVQQRAFKAAFVKELGNASGLVGDIVNRDAAESREGSCPVTLAVVDEIRREMTDLLNSATPKISSFLLGCLDTSGRIVRLEHATTRLLKQLEAAVGAVNSHRAELQAAFANHQASGIHPETTSLQQEYCRKYCRLLISQSACQSVLQYLRNLKSFVEKFREEQIPLLKTRLRKLISMSETKIPNFSEVQESLIDQFNKYLTETRQFRITSLLQRDPLSADAERFALEAAGFIADRYGAACEDGADTTEIATLAKAAWPFLRNVGGRHRVLAVTPSAMNTDELRGVLRSEFGDCVSVCRAERQTLGVLCEVEGIAIRDIADSLSNLRPRVVELAARVHCRQDIPW